MTSNYVVEKFCRHEVMQLDARFNLPNILIHKKRNAEAVLADDL